MRARELIVTKVITGGPKASVRDAVKILLANRISALPVIDNQGRLVGIISEGDLIRRAELGTNHQSSWWLELFSEMSKEALATRFLKSLGGKGERRYDHQEAHQREADHAPSVHCCGALEKPHQTGADCR
jgi:hypothetical protein